MYVQDAIAVLNSEKEQNAKLYMEAEKRFKSLIKWVLGNYLYFIIIILLPSVV